MRRLRPAATLAALLAGRELRLFAPCGRDVAGDCAVSPTVWIR